MTAKSNASQGFQVMPYTAPNKSRPSQCWYTVVCNHTPRVFDIRWLPGGWDAVATMYNDDERLAAVVSFFGGFSIDQIRDAFNSQISEDGMGLFEKWEA